MVSTEKGVTRVVTIRRAGCHRRCGAEGMQGVQGFSCVWKDELVGFGAAFYARDGASLRDLTAAGPRHLRRHPSLAPLSFAFLGAPPHGEHRGAM